ncbi:hypothetical protein AB2L27_12965 [Kineococcus sp. LSe6-4]|uniref:Phosphodiester glycosidase domain-containing protein n=1 Tax=Kineococcus halophytocola TaxID=3234027 RepID=A0ABV4H5J7_9ACTN
MTRPRRRRSALLPLTAAAALVLPLVAAAAPASAADPHPVTMPAGGPFSEGTAWRLDVREAPVAQNSRAVAAGIARQTAERYGGIAAFNVDRYSTSFRTVPADQRRVDVRWTNCQSFSFTPTGLLGEGGQFTDVPVPADAVPAAGTDGQLTIYSPSTDQLWEFWQAERKDSHWQACWGGRIDDVSRSQGRFSGTFGASASGLAVSGGTIGIEEVRRGSIEHAIALSLPELGRGTSYPASRGDGWVKGADSVKTGTRLRLPASLDVDALDLHPVARMVAEAAQRYGFIVTDTGGCTSVVAESPAAVEAATGEDPWEELLEGTPGGTSWPGSRGRPCRPCRRTTGSPEP